MNSPGLSKRYYCYSTNPSQEIRADFSRADFSGAGSRIIIHNGLTILERRSIPMMVQYICSTVVSEEENGTLHLMKHRIGEDPLASIISKYNSHSLFSEEIAFYLTDPNPLIRAIIQNYHSK